MTTTDGLTVQEKLLVAQAVYKLGAVDWTAISALLVDHPICKTRPPALFSPSACEEAYISMMTSIGQNVPAPDAMKPRNRTHLRLAQTFYVARLQELKEEIESCENRFSVLMSEINALKNGSMDDGIKEEIRGALVKKYGQRILQWLPDEAGVPADAKPSEETPIVETSEKPAPVTGSTPAEAKLVEDTAAEPEQEETQQDIAVEQPAEEAGEATPKPAERETAPEAEPGEVAATPKPSPSPSDDLSPPPSAVKESEGSATPAKTAPSPSPVEPKAIKRKASTQPRGAPIAKRGPGRPRRATTPVPTSSVVLSDAEHPEQEAEEEHEDTGRSRRLSKRHQAQDSPPLTSYTRGSSPATSRRAPSASSVASTPTVEEKKPRRGGRGRGMRDEVVSKSVREQSTAAESVKEEEEDEADSPAEEKEARPVRGKRGKKDTSPAEEKKEKEGGRRSTRSAKTPTLPGHDGDEEAMEDDGGRGKRRSTFTPTQSATPTMSVGEGKKGPRKSEPKDGKATQRLLMNLWEDIHGHQHGAVFHAPVKKSEAADYYSIIKKPMDLKTIKLRVKDGTITSIDEFERDILLMFANATMYNEEGSQVYEMAVEMSKAVEGKIAHFRGLLNDLKR